MSGSIDGGATLYNDERVQPQLKALAEKLHWDTSLIKVAPREEEAAKSSELDAPAVSKPVDAKEPVAFLGPADGKLMRGIDGNIYALDFLRSQPVDTYWMQEEISRKETVLTQYILRPELVEQLLQRRQESEIRAKAIRELLASWKKGEKIDKLLYGGYSTISLGYAGLYECVKYMTGKSHTDAGAKPFALSVMQHMNDKCNEWKKAENMDYSLYGTPLESTTYKFAKCLQKRFGIVPGITDKNYITNSYHVHVSEQIDAFTKLKFESEFQKLSPGGAISYVEVPNMQDNLEAVMSVLQFIYDNIMYAELNTKSDYCQVCGYDGEIKIVEDDGKLVWECPKCGNRDQNKLNVARRTCGYIGTQFWNQGRTQEIKDRVLHL